MVSIPTTAKLHSLANDVLEHSPLPRPKRYTVIIIIIVGHNIINYTCDYDLWHAHNILLYTP